jgi:hypothetical protein
MWIKLASYTGANAASAEWLAELNCNSIELTLTDTGNLNWLTTDWVPNYVSGGGTTNGPIELQMAAAIDSDTWHWQKVDFIKPLKWAK